MHIDGTYDKFWFRQELAFMINTNMISHLEYRQTADMHICESINCTIPDDNIWSLRELAPMTSLNGKLVHAVADHHSISRMHLKSVRVEPYTCIWRDVSLDAQRALHNAGDVTALDTAVHGIWGLIQSFNNADYCVCLQSRTESSATFLLFLCCGVNLEGNVAHDDAPSNSNNIFSANAFIHNTLASEPRRDTIVNYAGVIGSVEPTLSEFTEFMFNIPSTISGIGNVNVIPECTVDLMHAIESIAPIECVNYAGVAGTSEPTVDEFESFLFNTSTDVSVTNVHRPRSPEHTGTEPARALKRTRHNISGCNDDPLPMIAWSNFEQFSERLVLCPTINKIQGLLLSRTERHTYLEDVSLGPIFDHVIDEHAHENTHLDAGSNFASHDVPLPGSPRHAPHCHTVRSRSALPYSEVAQREQNAHIDTVSNLALASGARREFLNDVAYDTVTHLFFAHGERRKLLRVARCCHWRPKRPAPARTRKRVTPIDAPDTIPNHDFDSIQSWSSKARKNHKLPRRFKFKQFVSRTDRKRSLAEVTSEYETGVGKRRITSVTPAPRSVQPSIRDAFAAKPSVAISAPGDSLDSKGWFHLRSHLATRYMMLRGVARNTPSPVLLEFVSRILGHNVCDLEYVCTPWISSHNCHKVYCRKIDNEKVFASLGRTDSGRLNVPDCPYVSSNRSYDKPRAHPRGARDYKSDRTRRNAGARYYFHNDCIKPAISIAPGAKPRYDSALDVPSTDRIVTIDNWMTISTLMDHICIASWNVHGLYGCKTRIEQTLWEHHIVVCMCQETWLTAGPNGDNPEFEHYTMLPCPKNPDSDLADPRRGLCVLVMKGYEFIVRDIQFRKTKHDKAETQWFRIVCDNVKITCINAYMPDAHYDIAIVRKHHALLNTELNTIERRWPDDARLVAGDMNVAMGRRDGTTWGRFAPHASPNNAGRSLASALAPHNLWSHMGRRPGDNANCDNITYHSGKYKTAPDYILSRGIEKRPADVVAIGNETSDHNMCYIRVPMRAPKHIVHAKRSRGKLRVSKFGESIDVRNSFECLANASLANNFDTRYSNFIAGSELSPVERINHALKRTETILKSVANTVVGKSKGSASHHDPGWTGAVQQAYDKYQNTSGPFARRRAKRAFLKIKASELRAFEMQEIDDWLDAFKNRPSYLWKKISHLNGTARRGIDCIRDPVTDELCHGDSACSQALSKYIAMKQAPARFETEHEVRASASADDEILCVADHPNTCQCAYCVEPVRLPTPPIFTKASSLPQRSKCRVSRPIHMPELEMSFSPHDVELVRNSMANGKSAGHYDGIPPELFKYAGKEFDKIVSEIWNAMFHLGDCPQYWRDTVITLLYKKGDTTLCKNYRQIASMAIFGKMFTKCIQTKVREHCDQLCLLSNCQNGFRPGRSCVQHLIAVFETFAKIRAEGKIPHCFFIDFSAAFDTVDREKLYNVLESWGVDTKLIKFLRDMYAKTNVRPKCGQELGPGVCPELGFSQGDPWSPLAFCVTVNAILERMNMQPCCYIVTRNGTRIDPGSPGFIERAVMAYADDILIICDSRVNLLRAIRIMERLVDECGLTANVGKCATMCIGKPDWPSSFEPIYYKGQQLPRPDSYAYLGVEIEANLKGYRLNFEKQVAKILRNIGYGHHRLHKVLTNMKTPLCVKMRFIEGAIRPLCCYAAEAWTPTKNQFRVIDSRLLKLYRKAIECDNQICSEVLQKLLRIKSVERDYVYFKKLFTYFTRFSSPDGLHNVLLEDVMEVANANQRVRPLSPYRKFLNMWFDVDESYEFRGELKTAMDIWDVNRRTERFNKKNTNNKYGTIVSNWMQEPDTVLSRERCLALELTCTDIKVLVESIGSTSLVFGPGRICAGCNKAPAQLEHCISTCIALADGEKCDLKILLDKSKGWRTHMNRLHRIVRKQRREFDTSTLEKGDVICINDDHRTISTWKVIGAGYSPNFHICHCEATGTCKPINTKRLAGSGRLQKVMISSGHGLIDLTSADDSAIT